MSHWLNLVQIRERAREKESEGNGATGIVRRKVGKKERRVEPSSSVLEILVEPGNCFLAFQGSRRLKGKSRFFGSIEKQASWPRSSNVCVCLLFSRALLLALIYVFLPY